MQETKIIIIHLHVGYCGMDSDEGWIVPVDMTDAELDDLANDLALDHAETYGYYPPDDENDEEDDDADGDKVSHNIEGSWKLYDEARDAGKLSYGNGPQFNTY